jgi:hypothetical protein
VTGDRGEMKTTNQLGRLNSIDELKKPVERAGLTTLTYVCEETCSKVLNIVLDY